MSDTNVVSIDALTPHRSGMVFCASCFRMWTAVARIPEPPKLECLYCGALEGRWSIDPNDACDDLAGFIMDTWAPNASIELRDDIAVAIRVNRTALAKDAAHD